MIMMIRRILYKLNRKQRKIDKVFLDICDTFSTLSHCVSKQVASVIVKDNRIISTGINGTATGLKNCDEIFDKKKFDRKKHHEFSNDFEIHSEMNAVFNAAKNGIAIDGCTLYCILEPCLDCSKNLSMTGIKRIVYKIKYDLMDKKKRKLRDKYLKKVGVKFEQY